MEIRQLQRPAEAQRREGTANLARATWPLIETVAQGEALLSYVVQEDTIYAVKRRIEETEEEHQFRPAGETNKPNRISATVVSSVGVDLDAGTSLYLTRLVDGPKPVYRISRPGGGRNLIARAWVWEGDPEKTRASHSGPAERQRAKLQAHETQPAYPVDPIVVCTLAPADGDLQQTLFGRYWSYAISEALKQAGCPVDDDHPLIPEDGQAYLWGTYSEGEATAHELFTEAIPHELIIETRIRRRDPDIRLRARTAHLQKQLRSLAQTLFPAKDR